MRMGKELQSQIGNLDFRSEEIKKKELTQSIQRKRFTPEPLTPEEEKLSLALAAEEKKDDQYYHEREN